MEKHSCPKGELSCIIGSLFVELEPPCSACGDDELIICGTTHSGKKAMLSVFNDTYVFTGDAADLKAVLNGKCPEKRPCKEGGSYG